MAKKKAQPVQLNKSAENRIIISRREIEKKIRKHQPPVSRLHKDKTRYSRKTKHPNNEE